MLFFWLNILIISVLYRNNPSQNSKIFSFLPNRPEFFSFAYFPKFYPPTICISQKFQFTSLMFAFLNSAVVYLNNIKVLNN